MWSLQWLDPKPDASSILSRSLSKRSPRRPSSACGMQRQGIYRSHSQATFKVAVAMIGNATVALLPVSSSNSLRVRGQVLLSHFETEYWQSAQYTAICIIYSELLSGCSFGVSMLAVTVAVSFCHTLLQASVMRTPLRRWKCFKEVMFPVDLHCSWIVEFWRPQQWTPGKWILTGQALDGLLLPLCTSIETRFTAVLRLCWSMVSAHGVCMRSLEYTTLCLSYWLTYTQAAWCSYHITGPVAMRFVIGHACCCIQAASIRHNHE